MKAQHQKNKAYAEKVIKSGRLQDGLFRGAVPLWEVRGVNYEKTYKDEQGIEMEIKIKAECLTDENMRKTLSFIAQSSHNFYLEVAKKISNKL